MSKPTEQLRDLRIFNDYGFFNDGGTRVYISYMPADNGRGGRSAYWQVYAFEGGREVKTNPGGHWRDYGRMTFIVWGRDDKAPRLAEAQAWCAERYGLGDLPWARSPFGGYGDAAFVKARLKELRAEVAPVPVVEKR